MKSTNYYNTFIAVADSCKRTVGTVPPQKTPATFARLKFDLISQNPYEFTADEALEVIFLQRKGEAARPAFLTTNHACFRCSPLAKSYGWGFHYNEGGKVAIYGKETDEYQHLLDDGDVTQRTAFSPHKEL